MYTSLDIGLLTCSALPELQSDFWLIRDELAARGYSVEPVIWNAPNINWPQIRNVIMCSPWDYHYNYGPFKDWLAERESECNIVNPPQLIRWNLDKSYLRHFESNNIATIPTIWIDKNASVPQHTEWPWQQVIVKPSVGASSRGMKRFDTTSDAKALEAHIKVLSQDSGVMIQPYLRSADERGETALIYFNGKFSHAIHRPLTGHQANMDEEVAAASYLEPTSVQYDIGKNVIESVPFNTAYCRVDLLTDDDGSSCVLEVEMIEPSLFLSAHIPSVKTYADCLEERWLR